MGIHTTLPPKYWMAFLLPAVWLKDGISLKGVYAFQLKIRSIPVALLRHARDPGKLEWPPVILRLSYQIIIFNNYLRRNIPIINSEFSSICSRHIKYHFSRATLNSLFLLSHSHFPALRAPSPVFNTILKPQEHDVRLFPQSKCAYPLFLKPFSRRTQKPVCLLTANGHFNSRFERS
ncbi:MAG: hypothetical protein WCA48_02615 [Pseudomonas gingeri]